MTVTKKVTSVFDVSTLNIRLLGLPTHIIFDANCGKIWLANDPIKINMFCSFYCFYFLSLAMQFKSFPVLRNDEYTNRKQNILFCFCLWLKLKLIKRLQKTVVFIFSIFAVTKIAAFMVGYCSVLEIHLLHWGSQWSWF